MVQNVIQIKSGIITNVSMCTKIQENNYVCEKDYIWNLITHTFEDG